VNEEDKRIPDTYLRSFEDRPVRVDLLTADGIGLCAGDDACLLLNVVIAKTADEARLSPGDLGRDLALLSLSLSLAFALATLLARLGFLSVAGLLTFLVLTLLLGVSCALVSISFSSVFTLPFAALLAILTLRAARGLFTSGLRPAWLPPLLGSARAFSSRPTRG